MLTLWMVIGCLFVAGIGVKFVYRILGLTAAEAAVVYVLIVSLVSVNTVSARQLIAALF